MNKELKHNERVSNANGAMIGGLVLIGMGVIFYFSFAGIRPFGASPWLLFILIPMLGVLYGAWQQYRASGNRLSRQVMTTAVFGLFPFIIGGMFAFGFGSSVVLPIMFILLGIGIIITQR